MRRKQSGRIALCGIMCGLAVVLMMSGNIIPFATFCAPALSGLLMIPVAMECGMRLGWVSYLAVSLLCILLIPDKEMAGAFLFLLGYYPLLKVYLERIHLKLLRILAKAAVVNAAIFAMYGVLLFLFPVQVLVQEFSGMGAPMLVVLLIMGNCCFWIYDAALVNIVRVYVIKLRPRIKQIL